MYKQSFGTINQITFNSPSEYYELLGYLSKNDGTTKLVWEENNKQGAWTEEGRILFYVNKPAALRAYLKETEGVGNIVFRVNCNDFIENIKTNHFFVFGTTQDTAKIKSSIPTQYHPDFNLGLNL